ncbi:MAG: carboxy-S-adenosyl-L-methionine synthase CmoA [Pseudohongiella sp.]|nr:carboxy-S-adenosyl-L-methionine synthase CmoA [Pseudohongiella sp.]MDO9521106.1 carboxy-S-adenosyl-L-methionine synthase CmoA [Pseudohongiella sp.]MDP2126685.1 carboxy-S-adenosyl-L-methionine synthase CmoA [Pseudohongiella sp.]
MNKDKPSSTPRDNIFASPQSRADFVFDDKVASVFSDMINRSVPGYATILSMIGVLAARYCNPGSRIYDLGCSLGGASLAMAHQIEHRDYELLAIDNSPAMTARLQALLKTPQSADLPISVICDDVCDIDISNASVVVLNFTLQFIAPEKRDALIGTIADGLQPGGILILSEKIRFPAEPLNELFIDLYHEFKQAQGYSALEVAQKRAALENVLIPETIEAHKQRLQHAGFSSCDVWFQCFNFCSMVAVR